MNNLTPQNFINAVSQKNILCIGDIILDNFINNELVKISDEDPVHVVKEKSNLFKLGGVGNVALNIKNTGAKIDLVCLGADDIYFDIVKKLLKENKIPTKIIYEKKRITTLKKRSYIDNYHLIRQDYENSQDINNDISNKLISNIKNILSKKKYDAILLSDYSKGLITKYFFKKLVETAKKNKVNIFTDPIVDDLRFYDGSFILKANRKEINNYLYKFNLNIDNFDSISSNKKRKILNILKKLNIKYIIITRSAKPTIFIDNIKSSYQTIDVNSQDIINTTGAGDTFFAYYSLFFLMKNNPIDTIKFAHKFSKFAVNKFGTYAPKFHEILINILELKTFSSDKDLVVIKKIFNELKLENINIGFTNGCFDIIHSGHIHLLKEAKSKCDFLIVGLNSDKSVKKIKGEKRPYNKIETRKDILSSFSFVDCVCIFNEDNPLNLIKLVKPNILFKGSDYKINNIIGSKFVKTYNGKVEIINMHKDYSSSKVLKQIERN